ncbi:hypothetical protein [Vibrio alfacsensis]|uniref:hypothetical protein n=1 Tax=Vibrio TaxID=662 RepID=UPI004068AAF0
MARRTQENTQITINTILDVATEQLITLGYERMSYTTLSEQTGIYHHCAYLHELHVQIESVTCTKLGQPCQHTIEWLIRKMQLSLQTYQ